MAARALCIPFRGESHPMGSFRPTGEPTTPDEIRHTRFGDREATVLEGSRSGV